MRRFLLLAVIVGTRLVHAQPDQSHLQHPSRPMHEAAQQHCASGTRFVEERQWDVSLIEFEASLNPTT